MNSHYVKIRQLKNKNKNKNKTQKNKQKQECSTEFSPFEKKVEELFKINKIDLESSTYNIQKEVIKDLKKAVNTNNIKPQNDFYSYINDRWLESYKRSNEHEYIVQLDEFRILQDKVYNELLEIVNDYITNPQTKNTDLGICMKTFYESQINWDTNQQSKEEVTLYVKELDELMTDKNNLWKLLGKLNENEIISWGSPISWSINPDDKMPEYYKSYILPVQLTLINIEIYFDANNEKNKKYLNVYLKYLKDLFAYVFGNDNNFNVDDIFECEVKMAKAFGYNKLKENSNGHNLITGLEASKILKLDWVQFSKALGYTNPPKDFIVSSLNYTASIIETLLNEWNDSAWRTYFIYIYIRQQQRCNEEGNRIIFDFNGKFVTGQKIDIDIKKSAIFGLGFAFSSFLNNQYIEKYTNKNVLCYANAMAEDLKTVFLRILKRNTWLQPHTKELAIKKLEHFNITIGSKIFTLKDKLLKYKNDKKWENLEMVAKWRHIFAIHLEGKKIIRDMASIDWTKFPPKFIGKQSYIVNAMYTPSENGIDIPLGYLQKPFIDLQERGIEYNLARIGHTISHEMSHSLDNWGSKYDYEGKLNNWWTPKDQEMFKKIQEDVINQYETFASYDGITFDAAPSIGEDLADISGMAICMEYLRDFQLKNKDNLSIMKLSFDAFFVYFADNQRQIINKKAISAQLKTNPHPLDKYRCNVPLSRSAVFRAIYDIKKGDKMWWHSTNLVWEN